MKVCENLGFVIFPYSQQNCVSSQVFVKPVSYWCQQNPSKNKLRHTQASRQTSEQSGLLTSFPSHNSPCVLYLLYISGFLNIREKFFLYHTNFFSLITNLSDKRLMWGNPRHPHIPVFQEHNMELFHLIRMNFITHSKGTAIALKGLRFAEGNITWYSPYWASWGPGTLGCLIKKHLKGYIVNLLAFYR